MQNATTYVDLRGRIPDFIPRQMRLYCSNPKNEYGLLVGTPPFHRGEGGGGSITVGRRCASLPLAHLAREPTLLSLTIDYSTSTCHKYGTHGNSVLVSNAGRYTILAPRALPFTLERGAWSDVIEPHSLSGRPSCGFFYCMDSPFSEILCSLCSWNTH